MACGKCPSVCLREGEKGKPQERVKVITRQIERRTIKEGKKKEREHSQNITAVFLATAKGLFYPELQ